MTRVVGKPESFASDVLAGYCDLYSSTVSAVPGGVLRAVPGVRGKVALVVGGGSGHYPAFAGFVGAGFADAAVCGDVFASPSTRHIYEVARRADRGAGVVLGFGNYAGDVLNFGAATEMLRADGIDTRVLAVTDDIGSGAHDEMARRRGVAGDLPIFKIVGAAAEAGLDLDEVERIGRSANAQTRSLGIAFSGCTLPGASTPLFELSPMRMGLGMGIHGEPGIDELELAGLPVLAELLVTNLLAEIPSARTNRVAAVLNGLGATKYEELFALWSAIAPRLRAAGLSLVAPEAGEFVTSLDMAGCSLTLTWLDDELEEYWLAPSAALGFRRGSASAAVPERVEEEQQTPETGRVSKTIAAGSLDSRASATRIVSMIDAIARALKDGEYELGRLDAQSGDGDHGQGMARGSAAAAQAAGGALQRDFGARTVLATAADAWADRAGGTSGALWGAGLRALSTAFDDDQSVTSEAVITGIHDALDRIVALGGAKVGDKTLIDVLVPFSDTLTHAFDDGVSFVEALREASDVATEAATKTAELLPKLGRARPAGEKNLGHVDPGAVSLALVVRTVADLVAKK